LKLMGQSCDDDLDFADLFIGLLLKVQKYLLKSAEIIICLKFLL